MTDEQIIRCLNAGHVLTMTDGACITCAQAEQHRRTLRNKRAAAARRAREDVYRDHGMRKVRGNLGGTYYE